MALLELSDLSVNYGEIEALRGVSFAVGEGEVVTLLGSNGAGKSTTLRAISGLAPARSGTISFDGKPIGGLDPRAIARAGIAHVPEGRRLFPGLTARENIMLGASNRDASAGVLRSESEAMFELFPDIRPFADVLAWKLSGGQQQMVALARGLMAKPRLLLLDEPSLGLAPVIVQAVFRIIADIHRRGTTVLLVEQNAHLALGIANFGHVLESGRLAVSGTPATLWSDDRIRDAYLGGAAQGREAGVARTAARSTAPSGQRLRISVKPSGGTEMASDKIAETDAEANKIGALSSKMFLRVEVSAYLVLGLLLALVAMIGTVSATLSLVKAGLELGGALSLVVTIDRILLVLMVIEILHTVRVSFNEGALVCEPFLIVGLIASIRRVLVITLESSQVQEPGKWTPEYQGMFNSTMIELVVLGGLILAMVWSIFLLRRSRLPRSIPLAR
jgi:branched-chain amino acid transport system ATP-binding protein